MKSRRRESTKQDPRRKSAASSINEEYVEALKPEPKPTVSPKRMQELNELKEKGAGGAGDAAQAARGYGALDAGCCVCVFASTRLRASSPNADACA